MPQAMRARNQPWPRLTTGAAAPPLEPEFVPLHKYYISPTGNDSNDGLTPATAWRTAFHPVVCGDVVIVQPGTYNAGQFSRLFGVVSNCPSTTGGIDGAGGIYFAVLLCGGSDLMSCKIVGLVGSDEPLVKFSRPIGQYSQLGSIGIFDCGCAQQPRDID
jgi:hypothetical protein